MSTSILSRSLRIRALPSSAISLSRPFSSSPSLLTWDTPRGNGGGGSGNGNGNGRPRRSGGQEPIDFSSGNPAPPRQRFDPSRPNPRGPNPFAASENGGGGGRGGGMRIRRAPQAQAPSSSDFERSTPPHLSFSSSSQSQFSRTPSSAAELSSPSSDWVPHTPSRTQTSPKSLLSPSKQHAHSRQSDRIRSINLDKPKWSSEAGERIADRVVRSAAAVGLGDRDVGSELEEKRRRSRRFRTEEERAQGNGGPHVPAGEKRGSRGVRDLQFQRGGGAGGEQQKMVAGRANWRVGREEKGVQAGPAAVQRRPVRAKQRERVMRKVEIPSTMRLDNLLNILKLRLFTVQKAAERIGLTDVRPDRLLNSEDASLLCLELGFDPIVDDEAAFDLFPLPPSSDPSSLPPRPPITGIFGHVDHGKTSLLDALRSTTVAAGEAGGITQHIGAFEVPVETMVANLRAKAEKKPPPPPPAAGGKKKEGEATITFLDTPGHAAFTAMRSRGAGVTDVVVLVCAADDGVKPQTEEVISLIKSAGDSIGVVVALTKVDKPGVDTLKVKQGLMAAGIEIEDFGGEVPCVEVSSVTGQGLAELLETISAIAEVRELRAEREGRVEGRVIESRVEKGRGNVATILVLRGCLKPSASLVAGTTWARVRTLLPPSGKAILSAYPGQPVEVTGWKDLPSAGDLVLEAGSEDEAKKAVTNRLRRVEEEKLWSDVEVINEKVRRDAEILALRRDEEDKARQKGLKGNAVLHAGDKAVEELTAGKDGEGVKELLLVIKADVSGTVEAVVGALQGIGNKEARVKILSSAVGDVSQADVDMARAVGATIVGFSVKAPGSILKDAARGPSPVAIHTSPIIYRLVDTIRQATADLLPKNIETRVHGEATVQMVFEISVKGRKEPSKVAGCKVFNGVFQKARKARVVRNGETLFTGTVSTLKQVKKDVTEIQKGVECGIAFDGFDGFEVGDTLQSVEETEVARSL